MSTLDRRGATESVAYRMPEGASRRARRHQLEPGAAPDRGRIDVGAGYYTLGAMRYACLGLLIVLLLSGCATYTLPQPPLTHGRATPRGVTIEYCGDSGA